MTLVWVDPASIAGEDIVWLVKADLAGTPYHSIPLMTQLAMIGDGRMQLYRLVPGPGVALG